MNHPKDSSVIAVLVAFLLSLSVAEGRDEPFLISTRVYTLPRAEADLLLATPTLRQQTSSLVAALDRMVGQQKADFVRHLSVSVLPGTNATNQNNDCIFELRLQPARSDGRLEFSIGFQEAFQKGQAMAKLVSEIQLQRGSCQLLGSYDAPDQTGDEATRLVFVFAH